MAEKAEEQVEAPATGGEAGDEAKPAGSMLDSLMAAASAGIAKAQELDKTYKITDTAVATAQKGLETAKEMDAKYGVTETAKATMNSAVEKAKEMNEKYQIVDKAGKVVDASVSAAKTADAKFGVSTKVAAGAKIVMDTDEKYGVSKKVKQKVGEVDKKLKVSETVLPIAASMDEKLGVSKNVAAAQVAAMKMMGVYKCTVQIDEDTEFVAVTLTVKTRTLAFKDQSIEIPEGFKPSADGDKVKAGNFLLTFATPEDAAQFVAFVETNLGPKAKEPVAVEMEAAKEEEVVAAEVQQTLEARTVE